MESIQYIMIPAQLDINIYPGATWKRVFTLLDPNEAAIDITGCSFRAQIRKLTGATPIVIDLDSPNEITITDSVNGEFQIEVSYETTVDMTPGSYMWDMFIEWPDNTRDKIWQGDVTVEPSLTDWE